MNHNQPVQLSLGVSLHDEATFANFYAEKEANKLALSALQGFSAGDNTDNILIWGAPGAGLTHLLQAVCHDGCEKGRSLQYLPIKEMLGFSAQDICEGLSGVDIVCLDGIDHICGNREWEHALFHLFNNMLDEGHSLLISSHTSPPSLPILLPDLKSRLLGCVVYHIESLSDHCKSEAMSMRAAARGMELSEEVAKYILSRASRDTNELFYLLNRLDDESLQKQRKLTIPFVKDVLGI